VRVVADTGPVNYLLLIGAIDLLPRLFGSVLMPEAVRTELRHPGAPALVRAWADQPPSWLDVRAVDVPTPADPTLRALDDGEAAAILLADQVRADLVLMDDRAPVMVARGMVSR
jgi:predicted nucleic acid-binding protein